jgi:hypothetical protein
MTRLLFVVALLFSSNVFAKDYIRVVGEGSTLEIAKEQAFREAVQIRAGIIVLSERESTLKRIERDDINVYSAGYVRDYKIANVNVVAGRHIVTMDVLILDSKLFDQILSSGKSNNELNGAQAGASYQTFINQRNKGDTILRRVMSTYPQHAFIVSQGAMSISTDQYRNTSLKIPYQINWNYDYIVAFSEAMQMFDDNRFGRFTPAPSNVVIMGKNPKDFLLGSSTQYRFNDIIMLDRIKDAITGSREVRLMFSLKDYENKIVLKTCIVPLLVNGGTNFYGIGDPKYFVLHGNAIEKGTFQLNIKDRTLIERARSVELSAVAESNC